MHIKYRCLILDHDDTAVMSTPEIHYPSFVQALKKLRPHEKPLSLEEYIAHNFSPGFTCLCSDILKMTKEEQDYQYKVWSENTRVKVPDFYPGMEELLVRYKEEGGLIAVVSHSEQAQIERDYREKICVMPDIIFGWDKDENRRKPNPYPLKEILKKFGLKESEALVVDDLKPGMEMARSCGVPFAAVGWSHHIKEIEEYMRKNADYYFSTIDELEKTVFME